MAKGPGVRPSVAPRKFRRGKFPYSLTPWQRPAMDQWADPCDLRRIAARPEIVTPRPRPFAMKSPWPFFRRRGLLFGFVASLRSRIHCSARRRPSARWPEWRNCWAEPSAAWSSGGADFGSRAQGVLEELLVGRRVLFFGQDPRRQRTGPVPCPRAGDARWQPLSSARCTT